ncbi:hypothetical protein B296_00002427 [Ensete ventricosum]|uniref:Uncharacterized protein n=1 Tax=Ensete ventricosum TaxID=4639 RepID=A0A426ZZC0_ENSVE|nr:hypothetical protein B296_00002427 [Ensete ventricosum]
MRSDCIVDFIVAVSSQFVTMPMLMQLSSVSCIGINANGGDLRDVYGKDDGHLIDDLLVDLSLNSKLGCRSTTWGGSYPRPKVGVIGAYVPPLVVARICPPASTLTPTRLLLDNYISVDEDAGQHKVDDDEVNDPLLMEVGGIIMRANLIIVGGD